MTVPRSVRLCLLIWFVLPSRATGGETIELIPEKRVGWGLTNLFAPVTGLFLGGPGYWYDARKVEIDTSPPGAILELSYVRANFQQRFEQAESPVLLVLPSRIEAGPRDWVTVRAILGGYRQQEAQIKVRSRETKLMIDLAPLPNLLHSMAHISFAGRGSLRFLTTEALTFRVQETTDGFSVVLIDTTESDEVTGTLEGVASAQIAALSGRQLGEDLIVRVKFREKVRDQVELRSLQGYDEARELHHFTVDFVPADGGAAATRRTTTALARIQNADVSGCALEFDRSLRSQLESAALARALTPSGSFLGPYLRAAMKRLGEVSAGRVITLADGSTFHSDRPIELSAAAIQSAQARGYLALLRTLVEEIEPTRYRRNTLRGIVAPEVSVKSFDTMLQTAESLERHCAGLEPH